jgi:hypothetical protein
MTPGTSGVAVGKAWKDSDTATAGGLAAAGGIGTVKAGVEMESRARRFVRTQQATTDTLAARAKAAHANADSRKGKRGEPVRKPGPGKPAVTRHVQTTAQQRDWANNLDAGAARSAKRTAAAQRMLPGKVLTARRVKAGGLSLAAMGSVVGLKGLANHNRNRQMGY